MLKTKLDDFKFFKERCEYYIKLFKLDNWDIDILHRDTKDAYGKGEVNAESYVGKIKLNKIWGKVKPLSKENLDLIAKHEVIHFLIGRFAWLAHQRTVTLEELTSAEEELVNKLVNIIK